jgi:hypothetical protein
VVEYADHEAASMAVDALRSGDVATLVAVEADQNSLAAVFGAISPAAAEELLIAALRID